MPIQSKPPKDPHEDREPQRREQFDDEEAIRDERGRAAVRDDVNDDVMNALFEDDLRNMEGPDA